RGGVPGLAARDLALLDRRAGRALGQPGLRRGRSRAHRHDRGPPGARAPVGEGAHRDSRGARRGDLTPARAREARRHPLLLRGADPAGDRRGSGRHRIARLAAAYEGDPAPEGATFVLDGAPGQRLGRLPLVERVRLALLVPRAVGQLDDLHAAVLVELPRLRVPLEDPEPEPVGCELLYPVEKQAAGTLAVVLRIDVEVVEEVVAQHEEPDDALAVLRHPDLLVLRRDLADPGQDVLGAVDVREIGHALAPRAHMDVGQRGRVRGRPLPDRKTQEFETTISAGSTSGSLSVGSSCRTRA